MAPPSVSRRTALALAGSTLFTGCLASTNESTQPTRTTDTPLNPASDSSWSQLGRDSNHSGYNPSVPATCSEMRWNVKTKGPITTPTVVNDRVYVTRGKPTDGAPDATLEAYDLNSGEQRWATSLDTTFVFHAPLSDLRPIYYDGVLYCNVDERFIALDAQSRERLWETTEFAGFINDPPVVTDDAIYGAGREGLVCFDHDGNEQWSFTPDGRMGGANLPAVLDDTVYTTANQELVALDAATGNERWREQVSGFTTSVVVTDDEIVHAGHEKVRVFDPDRTERWQAPSVPKASIRPAVDDDTVYLADLNGNVKALELDSGETRWTRELPENEWAQGTIPTVTDGAVNLLRTDTENVTIYSLNAKDGETNWKLSKSGNRGRGPIPANDSIVFTSEYTPPSQRQSKTVSEGVDTDSQLWAFDV
ncbi:outer membrane protein assembly factor BamB family protein [Haladaptatus sp. NG-SE-30]